MIPTGRIRLRPLLGFAIVCGLLAILPAPPAGALVRSGAGPWVWENPLPQGNTLNDICFTSPTVGWAVGDNGVIMSTADGGAHWITSCRGSANLHAVFFVDAQHGWIGGHAGTMLRTTDGGATWTPQDVGTMAVNDIAVASTGAWDAAAIVAVGQDGAIRRTTNGGVTWPVQTSNTTNALLAVAFDGATSSGWATGASREIRRTTDGGQTWLPQTYVGGLSWDNLDTVTVRGNKGWIGSSQGRVLTTIDGGANWQVVSIGTGWLWGTISGLAFVSDSVGYATFSGNNGWTDGGYVFSTSDGGATWSTATTPPPLYSTSEFALESLCLVGSAASYRAWAVGTAGAVVAATDVAQAASWARQTSGAGHDLCDISMSSATRGWAAGYDATFLRTTDGLTWTVQRAVGTNRRVDSVVALSDNEAFAAGTEFAAAKCVSRTSNGGVDWVDQTTPTGITEVYDLAMVSSTVGWGVAGLGGLQGRIIHTVDGSTWTEQGSGVTSRLSAVDATDNLNAWVVGSSGVLRHTGDGGTVWNQQTVPSGYESAEWQDIDMVTGQMGWVVGSGGKILKTVDGTSWTEQASGVTQNLYGVRFVSATEGWACGTLGVVIHTVNGGTDWATEDLGTTKTLNGIAPLTSGAVWAAGTHGAILRRDAVAPVTTDDVQADGWIASRPVTLTPSDAVSGVASTTFKIDAGPWLVGTWLPPMAEGTHALSYFSTDNAGASEARVDRTIRVDATAPAVANDLPAGSTWRKPRKVTLTGTDTLSGVAGVYYRVDGGAPGGGAGSSCAVPAPPDGTHTLAYWAGDNVGNSGEASPASLIVRFDGKRPVPKALAAATVKKGKKATLRYRIKDALPGCGKANVTITIRTAKGKQVKKLTTIKNAAENKDLKASFVCTLKPGTYSFWVAAADIAGNKATKTASAKLTVR
jgi:photosystem II stability/assembly factor-like uncharacterized protein